MKPSVPAVNRRIVIAGGGTSGWMTAAMMSKTLPRGEYQITLIEPPGPRGIGVGEASVVSLVSLLQMLGADETDMMRRCEATYKLGIQFCDWHRIGHDNCHPFGVCGARIDGRDLFHIWLAAKKQLGLDSPYHAYSLQWAAAMSGRSPHSSSFLSPITQSHSYAFHFNAEALAGWLRDIALAGAVHEISGSVAQAVLAADGSVSAVQLSSGQMVEGDLFIDCSGFQSVLMNKALNDPFQPWDEHLLCDRAVAVKIPGKSIIPSYTKSQAMPAGWAWNIPLAQHTGLGYVYSSQFVSDEEAWEQLRTSTASLNNLEVSPRFLKMRVGRQANFWSHNVVAIGLSAGFLEPLESSGIHLSQIGIELLLKLFPGGQNSKPLQELYNSRMAAIYDEVRDFVQLHYSLTQRTDTPFWVAARAARQSSALKHRLQLYDDAGVMDSLRPEAFPETSYYHLLTGNGRLPRRVAPLALAVQSEQIESVLSAIREQNERILRGLPLHEEMLRHIHKPGLARAS